MKSLLYTLHSSLDKTDTSSSSPFLVRLIEKNARRGDYTRAMAMRVYISWLLEISSFLLEII